MDGRTASFTPLENSHWSSNMKGSVREQLEGTMQTMAHRIVRTGTHRWTRCQLPDRMVCYKAF